MRGRPSPSSPPGSGSSSGTHLANPGGSVPDTGPTRRGSRGRSEMYAGPYEDADRYRLVDKRSRGGEGELWKGVLPLDSVELPVAVKVILESNALKIDEWRERWRRQAELLRSCDHPGLVKVREVFEGRVPHVAGDRTGDRSLYLVMNWVEGPTVEQWVELAPERSTDAVLEVAAQVAAAVDHLHTGAVAGVSVIHRDIKPANVVMGPNGPCLVDFGFARFESDDPLTLVGTPSYLAPEVITGSRYGASTDRYAFAGTVYFALTGHRPDATEPEVMRSRMQAVEGFRDQPGAIELFLAMLSPDPAARPTSCSRWVEELRASADMTQDRLATSSWPRIYRPVDG
jgi:eukaryotic-like serine/threonine-protein kinase